MATYVYEAFTQAGKEANGTIDADNDAQARTALRAQGLLVMEVRPSRAAGLKKAEFKLGGKKVKLKDVAWAARNLATTQGAGLPVVRALKMLGMQRQGEAIGKTLLNIHEQVVNGSSLGEAFASEEHQLGPLTTALIQAGESSGKLDVSLAKLADLCDARVRLKRKVASAMAYPAVMIGLVILIFFAMLVFVVPAFKDMFDQLHGTLPAPTLILLKGSNFMTGNFYLLPLFPIGIVFGWRNLKKSVTFQHKRDAFMLKMPLFGSLFTATAVARLATTLASGLGAGVPLLDALNLSASVANNHVFTTALEAARNDVRDGKSLAAALAPQEAIPDLFTQLIAIGEETGAVDELLVKYAQTVEDEVETKVEGLTSVLEPLMIVVFGAVVGSMVVALYMPMLTVFNQIK